MNIFDVVSKLNAKNISFTMATVIKTSGSVPGKIGFKMVVDHDKNTYGTIGGGALELTVIKESLHRLDNNVSGIEEYTLSSSADSSNKTAENVVDMNCNGKTSIFYDVYKQNPSVYIFGGGHVGQALLYFLSPLNYYLRLVDNRSEIASKEYSPNADEIISQEYVEYASSFKPDENSYIVILTQGHRYDYDILTAIIRRKLKVKYIGIIASKNKAAFMINRLDEEFGVDYKDLNISTPVGLKIGGNTASEIALTIAAEIQSIHYEKTVKVD
jgi:xanthine dehydrogenase accessory factor